MSTREQQDVALLRRQLRRVDRLSVAGRLASVLAHKLGTPLNVVAGRASLIQLATTPAEAKEHGERIVSQAQRMAEILREWVDGLDESLGETVQLDGADSAALVSNAVALCADFAAARDMTIRVGEVSSAPMRVNPDALLQALDDLLINTIAISDPGASIVVRCTSGQVDKPPDYHVEGGHFVCLVIESTSGAFNQDDEGEPQLFWADSDGHGPVGLETVLARHLVRHEGGWIEASRLDPKGISVTVHIPFDGSHQEPRQEGGRVP